MKNSGTSSNSFLSALLGLGGSDLGGVLSAALLWAREGELEGLCVGAIFLVW
jgi:hypothetical protein